MKILTLFILTFLFGATLTSSQVTEIECTILHHHGSTFALKPAAYHPETLPKPGDQVLLSIYLKDDLPMDKNEGFYELYSITFQKMVPNNKTIVLNGEGDLSALKTKLGIDHISLLPHQKVKISWTYSR